MIHSIGVEELKKFIDEDQSFILVDCREIQEYQQGHIKGAKLIPLSDFEKACQCLSSDKEKTIVLQCRSGKRSLKAAQYLNGEGYQKLYNLEGGILAWQNEGLPIET